MPPLLQGELYSALCALFWAVAILLFRKSGEQIPPVALNLYKGAVALVLFVPTMLALGVPLLPTARTTGDWLTLLASGALGIGVADSLFFASLNRLGASGSAIVDCIYSPFIVGLAYLYLGEPLRPTLLLAVGMMVSAILVGTWAPVPLRGGEDARRQRTGVLLGVLSMLLMAAGIVFAKPVLNVADVWWSTPVRLLGGEVVLLAQSLVVGEHRRSMRRVFTPGRHWRFALPSALFGSYLAMIVWIAGMKLAPVGVAGLLNQTSTLWVALLAAPFLGERLTPRRGLAVALGFGGAVVATC